MISLKMLVGSVAILALAKFAIADEVRRHVAKELQREAIKLGAPFGTENLRFYTDAFEFNFDAKDTNIVIYNTDDHIYHLTNSDCMYGEFHPDLLPPQIISSKSSTYFGARVTFIGVETQCTVRYATDSSVAKKASFEVEFKNPRPADRNGVVSAEVLDSNLVVVTFEAGKRDRTIIEFTVAADPAGL